MNQARVTQWEAVRSSGVAVERPGRGSGVLKAPLHFPSVGLFGVHPRLSHWASGLPSLSSKS